MAKPTKKRILWSQQEIGVIIHYDITVFEQSYQFRKQWGYQPDAKKFAPTQLDTDQWIKTAKAAGAKYAILVTKHCTGFALFTSDANEYNVKNATYNKDIVKSFVESCRKYGIKPGAYYCTLTNAFENVDNPGRVLSGNEEDQLKYNQVLKTQLEELWSNYGEWFEIWFDGGTLPVEQGGLDIAPILKKLQPNALTFQGDRLHNTNNTRWVGNERGVAAFNCYSTINGESQSDGIIESKYLNCGEKNGQFWKPAECDAPNRKLQWFYMDNQDKLVLSPEQLFDLYFKSVGRNCNLLLGMVIDHRGLVPEKDRKVFEDFGQKVLRNFENRIGATSGKGKELVLNFENPTKINQLVIRENLENGHSVFKYKIMAKVNNKWKDVFKAEVIGNKRIALINPIVTESLKLVISDCNEIPEITEFSAYYTNEYDFSTKLKLKVRKYL